MASVRYLRLPGGPSLQISSLDQKRCALQWSRCPETFKIDISMYIAMFFNILGGFKVVTIIVNKYCHNISYLSSDLPTSSVCGIYAVRKICSQFGRFAVNIWKIRLSI